MPVVKRVFHQNHNPVLFIFHKKQTLETSFLDCPSLLHGPFSQFLCNKRVSPWIYVLHWVVGQQHFCRKDPIKINWEILMPFLFAKKWDTCAERRSHTLLSDPIYILFFGTNVLHDPKFKTKKPIFYHQRTRLLMLFHSKMNISSRSNMIILEHMLNPNSTRFFRNEKEWLLDIFFQ